jgi:hypothetical protein
MILRGFKGIYPRVAPEELPDGGSLIAENCKVASGAIVPVKASTAANAVIKTGTKTLYRHKGDWLSWAYDTDIARCTVARDAFGRIYFTTPIGSAQGGKVQMLNYYADTVGTKNTAFLGSQAPTGSYHLGMPAPTVAPVLGTPTGGDSTNQETAAWVYTYVSLFGEESAPSPATIITSRPSGSAVQVTWAAPGSDYTGRSPVAYVNIYRTNTGTRTTEYQFAAQKTVGDLTWTDSLLNAELVEVLATTDWLPPVTGLMGLCELPNGSLAGFRDNAVYFSVPYQPHAFPLKYMVSVPWEIVTISAAGMSVLVVTTGPAYVITGNTPGSMTPEKMEMSFSCISKRSVVDIGTAIVYASPVGLVAFSPAGSQVISGNHYSKEEWDKLYPSTLTAFQFAGAYLAFYDNGSGVKGGIVLAGDGSLTTLDSSFEADAGWYDQEDGELYLVINDAVVQFDVGPGSLTATRRSKVYTLPGLANYGAAKVIADSYPVTFKLYDYSTGSAVLKDTRTVTGNSPFTLSDGYLYNKFAVEVVSTGRVTAVMLAKTVAGLGKE